MWPEWYHVIEDKLKTYIYLLVARYRIHSQSADEIFNTVVAGIIQAEQRGTSIQYHLAYSKKSAQNHIIKLQKQEYQDIGILITLQGDLRDKVNSESSCDESQENRDLLCEILGAFKKHNRSAYDLIIMRDIDEQNFREIAQYLYQSDEKKAYDATRQRHSRALRDFKQFSRQYLGLV